MKNLLTEEAIRIELLIMELTIKVNIADDEIDNIWKRVKDLEEAWSACQNDTIGGLLDDTYIIYDKACNEYACLKSELTNTIKHKEAIDNLLRFYN